MTLHYTHANIERRRAGIETMTGLLVEEAGVRVQSGVLTQAVGSFDTK
jgi:hypothetical protein